MARAALALILLSVQGALTAISTPTMTSTVPSTTLTPSSTTSIASMTSNTPATTFAVQVDIGPTLEIVTSPYYGGTLTITCLTDHGSMLIQSIEIGKDNAIVASIGSNSQVVNHVPGMDMGIDSHLDGITDNAPFLRVAFHNIDCSHSGNYYCKVRSESVHTVNENVKICDDVVLLTLNKPDIYDPTHSDFRCVINTNHTEVTNVSFMELRRTKGSEQVLIASANVSERDGAVQKVDYFTQHGVLIAGHIDNINPFDSSIQAEFHTDSCDNAGDYSCRVVYKASGSAEERYAMAQATVPNLCSPTTATISLEQQLSFDPSSFSVTCGHNNTGSSQVMVLDIDLSLFPDVPNGNEVRRTVAFLDRYSQNKGLIIEQDYKERGFSGHTSGTISNAELPSFQIQTNVGVCNDTGVYRCKVAYVNRYGNNFARKVDIVEARLPACNPGALYSTQDRHGPAGGTFVCSVDPEVNIIQLFSLEISQIINGSFQVVAFIDEVVNDAQPVRTSGLVSVWGAINQFNPSSSNLGIRYTSESAMLTPGSVPTRCKAVYLSSSHGIVESFADGIMRV